MAKNTQSLYEKYIIGNYGVAPLTLVRGKGRRVWDDKGKRYLDFCSGIAVNSLGVAHPAWVKSVSAQAKLLAHASNLFRNEPQAALAKTFVDMMGVAGAKMFFCNSGTEANEALIKLARLYGMKKAGGKEGKIFKIVCAENAFHGRTFGSMAATPQKKIQHGFAPQLKGFSFGKFNDLKSFEKLVDKDTAAVLVEPVQGESGVTPATAEFLKGLRKLCDKKKILFMLDEIQCGIARSGTLLACQQSGIVPDAVSLAKGLGGGFPIGAIWVRAPYTDLLQPGMHGTTFGGNPLACAAGLAVLETIKAEDLLANVKDISKHLIRKLTAVKKEFPALVKEVRGLGLMIGIGLAKETAPVIAALRAQGLLVAGAGNHTIRFLPALNVTKAECDEAICMLKKALDSLSQ